MFGWLFFGFGMIFVWVFMPMADFSFVTFSGELVTVPGIFVSENSTNVEVNEESVWAYHYKYVVNGDTLSGVSYGRYGLPGFKNQLVVEYKAENPAISRLQGMSNKEMPWMVAITLLFPLAGLIIAGIGYAKGLKSVSLLKIGVPAFGKLIRKIPTNTTINENTVYRCVFEFLDERGQRHTMETKTHLTHVLEDDALEELLYDPDRPEFAITLDDLPGRPFCNGDGLVTFSKSTTQGLASALPALFSIVIHGAIFLYILLF